MLNKNMYDYIKRVVIFFLLIFICLIIIRRRFMMNAEYRIIEMDTLPRANRHIRVMWMEYYIMRGVQSLHPKWKNEG